MTAITTPQFSVLDEHNRKPDLNGVAAAVQAAPRYVEIRRDQIASYKASGMQANCHVIASPSRVIKSPATRHRGCKSA